MGCLYSSGQINVTLEARSCRYGKEYECFIVDVACPVDKNLILKKNEKLGNYSELRLKIATMWNKETLVVPITRVHNKRLRMQLEKTIKCRNFKEICFTRNYQHSQKNPIH